MINAIYQILSVITFLETPNLSVQAQAYTRLHTVFLYRLIKQSRSGAKKLLDFLEAMNKKYNLLQGGHGARQQKDIYCIH